MSWNVIRLLPDIITSKDRYLYFYVVIIDRVAFTYWPIWFRESWVQPYLIASFGHVIYLIGPFELVMVQPSFPPYLRHWNSSASGPRGIFPIVVSSEENIKLLWPIFILYYSDNITIENYYRSFCFTSIKCVFLVFILLCSIFCVNRSRSAIYPVQDSKEAIADSPMFEEYGHAQTMLLR